MSSTRIKVGVRVRPVKPGAGPCPITISKEATAITIMDTSTNRCIQQHPYDHVFSANDQTNVVYHDLAKDIVVNAVKGFNGTVFAYGQTASGKTHTMIGDRDSPGIVRLALNDIFESIQNTPDRIFLLRLSVLDIYNEKLTDLLQPSAKLIIRENMDGAVYVENLSEEICTSPEDILHFLSSGLARRHVAATNMNEYSSRSHTICRLIIESRPKEEEGVVNVSQLNFVDLAGSERCKETGAVGERLKEGGMINKSLFLLTLVINKLSEGQSHVNFRDSKLTRILQNALGGNSLTAIVCTVNPLCLFLDQTLSTLKFASSARNVQTKPMLNENVSSEAMLKRLQQEIAELRALVAQFECNESREKAQKALDEKEQIFRGAICSSTRSVEDQKPPKTFRRLTWAPRDRFNFALTITDDDPGKSSGPSSAIKRDLESVFGRSNDSYDSGRSSENVAKRSRRREVIFRLPTEQAISEVEKENEDEDEFQDAASSLNDGSFYLHASHTATDILVDIGSERSDSPIIIQVAREDKSVQCESGSVAFGDDPYSIGRELFLESSIAHFEAREDIVKLEVDLKRLLDENSVLKEKLAEMSQTVPSAASTVSSTPSDEKCRQLEEENALINSRYNSLKTKYEQVVLVLEDERKSDEEKASIHEAAKKVTTLEEQLRSQANRIAELEGQLLLSKSMENEFLTAKENLKFSIEQANELNNNLASVELEKLTLISKLSDISAALEEQKRLVVEAQTNLKETEQVAASRLEELSRLAANRDDLLKEKVNCEDSLLLLRGNNDCLQGKLQELNEHILNFEACRVETEKKLRCLEEDLSEEKKKRDYDVQTLRTENDQLQKVRDDMMAAVADSTAKQGELAQKLQEFEEALAQEKCNRDNETSTLRSEVARLQAEKVELAQLVAKFEAGRCEEERHVQSVQEAFSEEKKKHEDDVAKLIAENSQLRKSYEELSHDSDAKQVETERQVQNMEEGLLQEKNKYNADTTALRSEVDQLQAEREELMQVIERLELERPTIEAKVHELEEALLEDKKTHDAGVEKLSNENRHLQTEREEQAKLVADSEARQMEMVAKLADLEETLARDREKFRDEIGHVQAEREELAQVITKSEADRSELEKKWQALQEALSEEQKKCDNSVGQLQVEREELMQVIERLELERPKMKDRVHELEEALIENKKRHETDVERLSEEIQHLQTEREELTKLVADSEARQVEMVAKLADLEETLARDREKFRDEIGHVQAEREELARVFAKSEVGRSELEKKWQVLEEALSEEQKKCYSVGQLQTERDELTQAVAESSSRHAELKKKLEDMEENLLLEKTNCDNLRTEISRLQSEREEHIQVMSKFEADRAEFEKNVLALEESLSEEQKKRHENAVQLQAEREVVSEFGVRHVEMARKLQEVEESLLLEKRRYDDDMAPLRTVISQLQTEREDLTQASATFETTMFEMQKKMQALEEALSEEKGKSDEAISTLRMEKEQVQNDGQDLVANVDKLSRERAELEEKLGDVSTEMATLHEENNRLHAALAELNKAVEMFDRDRVEMEKKFLDDLQAERSKLDNDNALQAENKRLNLEREELMQAMAELSVNRAEVEAKLQVMEDENKQLLVRIDEGSRSCMQLTNEKCDVEIKLDLFSKDVASLGEQIKVLAEKTSELESEKSQLTLALEDAQHRFVILEEQNATSAISVAEKLTALEAERDCLKEQITQLAGSEAACVSNFSQQILDLERKVSGLEAEKCELEKRLQSFASESSRLWLEHQSVVAAGEENKSKLVARIAEVEADVVKLQQECQSKDEDMHILRSEIDTMFEENVELKNKLRQLREENESLRPTVLELRCTLTEKIEVMSRMEDDSKFLQKKVADAEQLSQLLRTEVSDENQKAASAHLKFQQAQAELEEAMLELNKLKACTMTSEAACNTSAISVCSENIRSRPLCSTSATATPLAASPPQRSRLSAVMPRFSSELTHSVDRPNVSLALSSSKVFTPVSPSMTSPFSASTVSPKDTPSKSPQRYESVTQTDDEPFAQVIERLEKCEQFKDKYILRSELESTRNSYHETVRLWDQLRLKMQKESDNLRRRLDQVTEAIGKVVDGGQLSPRPTPQGVSVAEKTTLTAVGGDTTLSISTSEDNVDCLINRFRIYLRDKEENARAALSTERDNWTESAKELEEEIVSLRKQLLNSERLVSSKDDEVKQFTSKIRHLEGELGNTQQTLNELRTALTSKADALRLRDVEVVDLKRSLDDRQSEIKRVQTELRLTTASLVVADEGQKTTERGFIAMQEQLSKEKVSRAVAEAALSDVQRSLSLARAEADSWRERSCKHEDEETRLISEVARLQAVFEAAEEQVSALNHQNTQFRKTVEDMEVTVTRQRHELDTAVRQLDQVTMERDQLAEQQQQLRQEVTKQQLLVESITKSVDAKEAKIEKARALFARLQGEKSALEARIKEMREEKNKMMDVFVRAKDERAKLEASRLELFEKCEVLQARLQDVSAQRSCLEKNLQKAMDEGRVAVDEVRDLKRIFAQQLKDLGAAWRQCLINIGMPISEQTEVDPQQLLNEVRWSCKHALQKINVLYALSGLGITCKTLYDDSYNQITSVENERRHWTYLYLQEQSENEKLKDEAVQLRQALAGCRCRPNSDQAKLMRVDARDLETLRRKPLITAAGSETKANAGNKENTIAPLKPKLTDRTEVEMDICSP